MKKLGDTPPTDTTEKWKWKKLTDEERMAEVSKRLIKKHCS